MNNDLFGQPETAPNRGIPNSITIFFFFLRLSIREASLAAFTVTGEQEGNQTTPFSKKTRSQAPSSLFSRDNAKKIAVYQSCKMKFSVGQQLSAPFGGPHDCLNT